MDMTVPNETKRYIDAVSDMLGADSQLVLVGGSVRDILLGRTPKDYDFATALVPDEAERRVRAAGKRVYTVGKRFGTIGFKLDGQFIELTTFRKELYSPGSRKPAVTFTSDLHEDLARRDFTMNALALDTAYRLIDPYDGAADIQAGLVRAVGKPADRFTEDPLRMLRMARFVARYGFVVEEATAAAAAKEGYLLTKISPERISAEMDGILVGDFAVQGLALLGELGLLSYAVPLLAVQVGYDQNSPWHRYELWEHSLKTMAAVPAEVELRWAALLHDIGKPFVRQEKPDRSSYVHHDRVGALLVDMIAHHLRWSKERQLVVRALVRGHMDDASPLRAADNAAK
ncbi:MAG TPA: CCA tRNA nucleotidyltransferase [Candidatus Saccharimonadales bacterium]|nr:CCA tRNA nucleotidyltransferase [Candidatus Saccharimonadales bacterium]